MKKAIAYRLMKCLLLAVVLTLTIQIKNSFGIGPCWMYPCSEAQYDGEGHFIKCSGCDSECSTCYRCVIGANGPECQEKFNWPEQTCCDCKSICNLWYGCQECIDGSCLVCGGRSGETCCATSTSMDCCKASECETCIDGECKVCGGDINKECCNGTCIDKRTHQCCYDPGSSHNCTWNESCCNGSCCDSLTCQACINGVCKNCNERFGTCCKCENGNCVECYCWDKGKSIEGEIFVETDIPLCLTTVFDSLVSDEDHWHRDCPDKYDAYPYDSLTYMWDQIPGSNPSIGIFIGDKTQSSVYWQAPSCIGSITIKLNANDIPDPMYNLCPGGGGTRDDDPRDFQRSVNVVLPDGCSIGGSKTVTMESFLVTESTNCIACGSTGPGTLPTTDVPLPTYNECAWVFSVYSSLDMPSYVCPSLFTEISGGSDPDITQNNLCSIISAFGGCGTEPECPPWGNASCIRMHETGHYLVWMDCVEIEEAWLRGQPSLSDMEINCDNPSTCSCQSARDARIGDINADVTEAWWRAAWNYNLRGETTAIAMAAECFSDLVTSICSVWNCSPCR